MYSTELASVCRGSSWIEEATIIDADDGSPIDLTGGDFELRVAPVADSRIGGGCWDYGYWALATSQRASLTASLGNGIVNPMLGLLQWRFTPDQINALGAGEHRLVLTMTRAGETDTLIDAIILVIG